MLKSLHVLVFEPLLFLQISLLIKKNFTDIHSEIVKKSDSVGNVKERVTKLISNSKNLYLTTLMKLDELTGMNLSTLDFANSSGFFPY